mmetsp:Transcript_17590/g.38903  ORF Transcript_17590/g.38903 Transcript_17590/m.38903 type:complete len:201 (-) Transcript_17590:246-848(-)
MFCDSSRALSLTSSSSSAAMAADLASSTEALLSASSFESSAISSFRCCSSVTRAWFSSNPLSDSLRRAESDSISFWRAAFCSVSWTDCSSAELAREPAALASASAASSCDLASDSWVSKGDKNPTRSDSSAILRTEASSSASRSSVFAEIVSFSWHCSDSLVCRASFCAISSCNRFSSSSFLAFISDNSLLVSSLPATMP